MGSFTVLDRFPDYLPAGVANAIYILASVAAAIVLTRGLWSSTRRASGRLHRFAAATD